MNYPYQPYNPIVANQQARLQQMEQQYNQMIQPQAYQPQTQPYGINGRIIDDVTQITASEIPMDGSVAIFPKKDLSEVYMKQWNANGGIQTLKFVPFIEKANNSTIETEKTQFALSDDVTRAFMERLDSIENKIDGIMGVPKGTSTTPKKKKESEAE